MDFSEKTPFPKDPFLRTRLSFLSFSDPGTFRPKSRNILAIPCLELQKKAPRIKFLSGISQSRGHGYPDVGVPDVPGISCLNFEELYFYYFLGCFFCPDTFCQDMNAQVQPRPFLSSSLGTPFFNSGASIAPPTLEHRETEKLFHLMRHQLPISWRVRCKAFILELWLWLCSGVPLFLSRHDCLLSSRSCFGVILVFWWCDFDRCQIRNKSQTCNPRV